MSQDALDVREVLAMYVRAADRRDGAAMASLFVPGARVRVFHGRGDAAELLGELVGPEAIGHSVGALMEPHPVGGFSHHVTSDAIVEIDGDRATLDAQYVVFQTRARARPESGWPSGARGAQGTITPIEAGYYKSELVRAGRSWKIVAHRIEHDLPYAFPAEPA